MKSKLLGCLAATVLGAAIVVATPAMAFRGGFGGGGFHGGGFGGFHGGGFGGFHGGGFGGFHGGGFGGFHGGGFNGGFRGGMFTGRSVFVPGAGRFAGAPFAGRSFAVNRFNNHFFFRNRFGRFGRFPFRNRFFFNRFNNFAFVGVPFAVGFGGLYGYGWPYYGYGGCWRQIWTGYGFQWVNVCYDYGYGYGY